MKATALPAMNGELLYPMASLARANTMRLAAQAEWLAAPRTTAEVEAVLARPEVADARLRVLGGGANVVFGRQIIEGLVLSTARLRQVEWEGSRVRCGAGVLLPKLIGSAIARSYSGLEVLAGIPGTLGGAVAQNAGGKWGEIGALVDEVALIERDPAGSWRVVRRRGEEVPFGYRTSGLKGSVIVEVTLDLAPAREREALRDRYREIIDAKRRTQPLGSASAGCVFKNPALGLAAARLIDEAGWKGRGVGDAIVSPIHANFIVNNGAARPHHVTELIERVFEDVAQRNGIELEREVEVW